MDKRDKRYNADPDRMLSLAVRKHNNYQVPMKVVATPYGPTSVLVLQGDN